MSFVPPPPADPTPVQREALVRLSRTARRLSSPSWVSLAAIGSEWVVITGLAALALWANHPLTWCLAVLGIGMRQHGLTILMHEGVHGRLHHDSDLNELVSDGLCAWPLFISTAAYRASHLQHHRALNTPDDPDWVMRHDRAEWAYPTSLPRLGARLIWMGIGGGVLAFFRSNRRMQTVSSSVLEVSEQGWRRIARGVLTLGPPLIAWWSGLFWAYLVLWILPILTVLPLLVRIRVVAEHYGLPANTVFDASRDWTGGPLLNWMLVPWGIRIHRTHHLFPAVPFHRLATMQAALSADPEVGPSCPAPTTARQLVGELTR